MMIPLSDSGDDILNIVAKIHLREVGELLRRASTKDSNLCEQNCSEGYC
jgi:hypothetical protein